MLYATILMSLIISVVYTVFSYYALDKVERMAVDDHIIIIPLEMLVSIIIAVSFLIMFSITAAMSIEHVHRPTDTSVYSMNISAYLSLVTFSYACLLKVTFPEVQGVLTSPESPNLRVSLLATLMFIVLLAYSSCKLGAAIHSLQNYNSSR